MIEWISIIGINTRKRDAELTSSLYFLLKGAGILNKTLTCSLLAPPRAFLIKWVDKFPSSKIYSSPPPLSSLGTWVEFSTSAVEDFDKCDNVVDRETGPLRPERWAPTRETTSELESRSLERTKFCQF